MKSEKQWSNKPCLAANGDKQPKTKQKQDNFSNHMFPNASLMHTTSTQQMGCGQFFKWNLQDNIFTPIGVD